MGLITRLQQKPEKVRVRIAFILALFVVACLALVGFLFYENPYKVDPGARAENPIRELGGFVSEAREDANEFVAPLENQLLIQ